MYSWDTTFTPQMVTGESPVHVLTSKLPRLKLDFLIVARESNNSVVSEHNVIVLYVGGNLWATNFPTASLKYLPGGLQHRMCVMTVTVTIPDRRVSRRHTDQPRAVFQNTMSRRRQRALLFLR